jgi:hypothetical protein
MARIARGSRQDPLIVRRCPSVRGRRVWSDRGMLPYVLAAQHRKPVTHYDTLRILDGLLQLSVLDWAGWHLNVAHWTDGAWLRLPPRTS